MQSGRGVRVGGEHGRILLLDDEVGLAAGLVAHGADLDVVVVGDGGDGEDEAGGVDGRERVLEHQRRRADRQHLFEDAADAERHHARALQQRELRRRHQERQTPWEQQDPESEDDALF